MLLEDDACTCDHELKGDGRSEKATTGDDPGDARTCSRKTARSASSRAVWCISLSARYAGGSYLTRGHQGIWGEEGMPRVIKGGTRGAHTLQR